MCELPAIKAYGTSILANKVLLRLELMVRFKPSSFSFWEAHAVLD